MRRVLSIVLVLTTAISFSVSGCRRKNKPSLEERTKVEEEISHLKNEKGNIYVSEKKEYEKMVSYLLGEVEKSNFRGSLIVATDDEVIFASGTHLTDMNGNEVTPETVYEIGSLTKSFVAVCTMKLVEEGKLSLDDTLGKFFPEYISCPNFESTSKVRIYDMLHMRSGLPDYLNAPELFFDEETILRIYGWNSADDSKNDERIPEERLRTFFSAVDEDLFLTSVYTCTPLSAPDTTYNYSNTNYTLLSMIIEKVSGKKYEDYVSEVVFEPSHMHRTTSMKEGDTTASFKEEAWLFLPMYTKGAGDIHSTVVDLLKYDRALFGGYLLSEKSMEELLKPVEKYACGWYVEDNTIHHNGATEAFGSEDFVIEKNGKRLYVIMLANNRETRVERHLCWTLEKLFDI